MKQWPWKLIGGIGGAAAVMFVIGYLIAARVLFPPLPEPENGILVPNLHGLTVESARDQLAKLGLTLADIVEIAHPTQTPGLIIAQSPLPGQQLRAEGSVSIGVAGRMPLPAPAPAPAPDSVAAPTPDSMAAPTPDSVLTPDTVSLFR